MSCSPQCESTAAESSSAPQGPRNADAQPASNQDRTVASLSLSRHAVDSAAPARRLARCAAAPRALKHELVDSQKEPLCDVPAVRCSACACACLVRAVEERDVRVRCVTRMHRRPVG